MKTIAKLRKTCTRAEAGILDLLRDAERELKTVSQFQHYNKVCNMGASEEKIQENLGVEVMLVVEYRSILGLCSYASDLDSQGYSPRDLPKELR